MRSRLFAFMIAIAYQWQVHAASQPKFDNISVEDFDKIVKEFSANSMYTSVSPASSLGRLFGFELGVLGGLTSTPDINSIVQRTDPSINVSSLPHAALLGALTVPFGLTAEVVALPEVKFSSGSYQQFGAALKWTATDHVLTALPFSLAAKVYYTSTTLSFAQTINNSSTGNVPVDVNVKFNDTVTGMQIFSSAKLFFIEPYLGLGYASATGKADITGSTSATFFGSSFPANSQSATSSPKSSQIVLGTNLQFLVFVLGAEYVRAFGTNTYNGKLSLRF